jgi:hypothetical protein
MLLPALLLMLLAGGCSTVPPPKIGPVAGVHFVIVNLSDCEWRITLTLAGGGPAHVLHLSARESQETDLAGGAYGIEQTALNGSTGLESTRRFTVRLEPGQTYRWRLATLLSATPGGTPANDEHER